MGGAASRACSRPDTAGDDVETIDGGGPCPSQGAFVPEGEEEAPGAFLGCYCRAAPERYPWECADSDEGDEGSEAGAAHGHCVALPVGLTGELDYQVGSCRRPVPPPVPPAHPLAQVPAHWPAAVFGAPGMPPQPCGTAPGPNGGQAMGRSGSQVLWRSGSQVLWPGGLVMSPPQPQCTAPELGGGPGLVEPPPRVGAPRAAEEDGAPLAGLGASAAGDGPSLEADDARLAARPPSPADAAPQARRRATDGCGAPGAVPAHERSERRKRTDGCAAPPVRRWKTDGCSAPSRRGGSPRRSAPPPRGSSLPGGAGRGGGKPDTAVRVLCAGDPDGSTIAAGVGSEGPPPVRFVRESSSGPCFAGWLTEADDGAVDLAGTFKLVPGPSSPAARAGRRSFVLDF